MAGGGRVEPGLSRLRTGHGGVCNQGGGILLPLSLRFALTILAERNTLFYASEISALQRGFRGAFLGRAPNHAKCKVRHGQAHADARDSSRIKSWDKMMIERWITSGALWRSAAVPKRAKGRQISPCYRRSTTMPRRFACGMKQTSGMFGGSQD